MTQETIGCVFNFVLPGNEGVFLEPIAIPVSLTPKKGDFWQIDNRIIKIDRVRFKVEGPDGKVTLIAEGRLSDPSKWRL